MILIITVNMFYCEAKLRSKKDLLNYHWSLENISPSKSYLVNKQPIKIEIRLFMRKLQEHTQSVIFMIPST